MNKKSQQNLIYKTMNSAFNVILYIKTQKARILQDEKELQERVMKQMQVQPRGELDKDW